LPFSLWMWPCSVFFSLKLRHALTRPSTCWAQGSHSTALNQAVRVRSRTLSPLRHEEAAPKRLQALPHLGRSSVAFWASARADSKCRTFRKHAERLE